MLVGGACSRFVGSAGRAARPKEPVHESQGEPSQARLRSGVSTGRCDALMKVMKRRRRQGRRVRNAGGKWNRRERRQARRACDGAAWRKGWVERPRRDNSTSA